MTPWRLRERLGPLRRLTGAAAALALGLTLGAGVPTGSARADHGADSPLPGKEFAAYDYGWYPIRFMDHFNAPLARHWRVFGDGTAGTQRGMFTLHNRRTGSVGVKLKGRGNDRGRWEVRLRAKYVDTGHAPVTAVVAMVPAGWRPQHCGARDIGLASYSPRGDHVDFYARDGARQWTGAKTGLDLSDDYWHTFAVEVRPRRIIWFVDAHPVRSVPREAYTGVPLSMRIALEGSEGPHNLARLQIDTVRGFSLKSPNDRRPGAPRAQVGAYPAAC